MTKLTEVISSSSSYQGSDVNSEILSESDSGTWVLTLPTQLRAYQQELEGLLGKVFKGRPASPENLALAKQLSLNWCASKCRQTGMSLESCLQV